MLRGYTNETIEDANESTIFLTEFEKTLPLRAISLVEFERRVKKLASPSMKDYCTVQMLIECFKDHPAFKEIETNHSLVRDLMFADMFMQDVEEELPCFHLTMPPSPTKNKMMNSLQESMVNKLESTENDLFLSRKVFIPHLILLGLLYC